LIGINVLEKGAAYIARTERGSGGWKRPPEDTANTFFWNLGNCTKLCGVTILKTVLRLL